MPTDPIMRQTPAFRARAVAHSKAWKGKNRIRVAEQRAGIKATRPKPLRCEVCGRRGGSGKPGESKPLHFDHCHVALQFRGWLCAQCNQVLGLVSDNPETLRALARYLEAFQIADLAPAATRDKDA